MKKFSAFLLIVLVVSVLLNAFVLFGMHTYKQRVSVQYEVNEANFNHSVLIAVSNYLSNIVSSRQHPTNKPMYTVKAKLLDDATIYPDYVRNRWVLLVSGVRYVEGDFYDSYLIDQIYEDKVYCRDSSGILIFRPVRGRDVASGGARPRRAENQSNDARALD